ncbi:hypothetical protein QUF50_03920 [Thiotrichales bacterium HSG1]|nr:hypothetical protein [Thiotrichales bacterium HSG1]
MRLSYITFFLVFSTINITQAQSIDVNHSHIGLTTVPTNVIYNNYLDGFEMVRYRKRGDNDVPASLWEFDVSSPGDFCYNSVEKVVLWRPDAGKKGEELQMVKIESDQEYSITWPVKRHTITWPSSVSLADGPYLIGIGNATNKISLHKIPADTSLNLQEWMLKQGCNQQVEILKNMQTNSKSTGI